MCPLIFIRGSVRRLVGPSATLFQKNRENRCFSTNEIANDEYVFGSIPVSLQEDLLLLLLLLPGGIIPVNQLVGRFLYLLGTIHAVYTAALL